MKSKIGLYLAVFAFVITFIITRGKMIDGSAVFWRIVFNTVLSFLLGAGLEFLYKKYFVKSDKKEETGEIEASVSDVKETINENNNDKKGSSLDITVGESDIADSINNDEGGAESVQDEQKNNSFVPPPAKKKTSVGDGKAHVDGDFIVLENAKIPNDPKLIAQAIKTKLSDE